MKHNRLLIVFLVAALMLSACNLPKAAPAEPTSTTTVSAPLETPTVAETPTETLTPLPTDEPTITPTPTASIPMVTPIKDAVNCRFGPSTNFEQVAALQVGASAQILGKSSDGAWWQVQNPSGGSANCWVSTTVVDSSGDLDVSVVAPPTAYITSIKIQVKPNSVNLGSGCPGPAPVFSIKGIIHVNGPFEIKWHIETEKDGPLPDHSLSFPKFGDYNVSYDYTPTVWDKGKYWVRVVITSPSSQFEETKYEIKCS